MTLREMSVEYRAQAQALRGRMQELEKAWKQTEDPAERANLEGRIWTLEVLWRETRDQAVLLEQLCSVKHLISQFQRSLVYI